MNPSTASVCRCCCCLTATSVCCDPQTQLPPIATVVRHYIRMLYTTTAMMMIDEYDDDGDDDNNILYLCRPNFVLPSSPHCHGPPRQVVSSSPSPRWPLAPWHGTRACPRSALGRRTTDEASQRWPTARTIPIKYTRKTL